MMWLWKNGIPSLAPPFLFSPTLLLTTGTNPLAVPVTQISPYTGFQMLGVYATPSGNFQQQLKILRGYAETFKSQIMPSSLSPSEAYCCMMQYIRPKLNVGTSRHLF
jgi:hypothetical protein